MRILASLAIAVMAFSTACQCAQVRDDGAGLGSSSSETSTGGSSSSSGGSTGEPFDVSRWLGRYHYESVFLPFGELGDPHGSYKLVNFEIFADSRAELFHDECSLEEPIVIAYEWEPDEVGWLRLRPGDGEASLRFGAAEKLDSLRVQLIEPCRELEFEIDGISGGFGRYFPGESCWVVRCTVPNLMQVDYCEGEEPPPCP
jgi:hypothetical protein